MALRDTPRDSDPDADSGSIGLTNASLFAWLLYYGCKKSPVANHFIECPDLERVGSPPSHRQVFEAWLSQRLENQFWQVRDYQQKLSAGRRELLRVWLVETNFEDLMPDDVFEGARSLFISDLKSVIRLIRERAEPDGAAKS